MNKKGSIAQKDQRKVDERGEGKAMRREYHAVKLLT